MPVSSNPHLPFKQGAVARKPRCFDARVVFLHRSPLGPCLGVEENTASIGQSARRGRARRSGGLLRSPDGGGVRDQPRRSVRCVTSGGQFKRSGGAMVPTPTFV